MSLIKFIIDLFRCILGVPFLLLGGLIIGRSIMHDIFKIGGMRLLLKEDFKD